MPTTAKTLHMDNLFELYKSSEDVRVLPQSVLTSLKALGLPIDWAKAHWESQPTSSFSTSADQAAAAAIAQAISTSCDTGEIGHPEHSALSLMDAHLDSADSMGQLALAHANQTVVCEFPCLFTSSSRVYTSNQEFTMRTSYNNV